MRRRPALLIVGGAVAFDHGTGMGNLDVYLAAVGDYAGLQVVVDLCLDLNQMAASRQRCEISGIVCRVSGVGHQPGIIRIIVVHVVPDPVFEYERVAARDRGSRGHLSRV